MFRFLQFRRPLESISQAVFLIILCSILCVGSSFAQTKQEDKEVEPDLSEASNTSDEQAETDFDPLSARAWMSRLATTLDSLSFELAFVVSKPNRETLPYIWRHAILENGDSVEQLSLLNGPGYEQIRLNNKVSIFEPGVNPFSIRASELDGPIPTAFVEDSDALYESYEVLLMGRNRVSGRMAQQIRVISKDKSRYGYHLWLDEQTGLLLKLNMYNLDATLLKQIQVTQLAINEDIEKYFVNIQPDQLPPVIIASEPPDRQLQWDLGYLPEGFKKVKQNIHKLPITNQLTEYILLSDGLVDVSVYVMEASDAMNEDISVTSDAVSIVSKTDGRIQVTVVGEIPVITAEKIASSIVLVNEQP